MTINVFVLEDADNKFNLVKSIVEKHFDNKCYIQRATSMVEAADMIFDLQWNLFILDVSLDLSSKAQSFSIPTQTVLGGLQVAKTIELEGLEAPTIIFTAFESFSEGRAGKSAADIVDLAEVDRRATEILGENHIGTVRFGADQWASSFQLLLNEVNFG